MKRSALPALILVQLLFGALLLISTPASADVYKCVNQDSKIFYSDAPCAHQDSNAQQKVVKMKISPPDKPSVDYILVEPSPDMIAARKFAEEQASKERKNEEQRQASQKAQIEATRKAQQQAVATRDNKLIADCEANRGVNCSDPKVIEQIRKDNTPLTPEELQDMLRERRLRQMR